MTEAIEALHERIARAICLSKQGYGDSPSVAAQYVDTFWRDYLPEARIAVSALENGPAGLADATPSHSPSSKDQEIAGLREELRRKDEALKAAHEYVVDGLNAQDQRRRDVEGYPGLMTREQARLDDVRADLRLVDPRRRG